MTTTFRTRSRRHHDTYSPTHSTSLACPTPLDASSGRPRFPNFG